MTVKRLLVVDDEPDFGEFVRDVAEDLSFDVTLTTGAKTFKQEYAKFDPTTVLLDIIMPDTDGIELVIWLAQNNYAGKVIVATGFTSDYGLMAQTLGRDKGLETVTFLSKPVRPDELRHALSQ